MFEFNFKISEEDLDDKKYESEAVVKDENKSLPNEESKNVSWLPAKKIIIKDDHLEEIIRNSENLLLDARNFGNTSLKCLEHESVLEKMSDGSEVSVAVAIAASESLQSDLIPSVYEGGLKVWECTWDLLQFISSSSDYEFKDKRVLELGCGAALPGIYTLLNGATVTLQDYNDEVVNLLTVPNTLLNLTENVKSIPPTEEESSDFPLMNIDISSIDRSRLSKVTFYAGDWGGLPELLLHSEGSEEDMEESEVKVEESDETLEERKYDFILSSETIYNKDNYKKLIDVFASCLKRGGVVLLAAKRYYFGVGGGSESFLEEVDRSGKFSHRIVYVHEEGLKREIMEIKLKQLYMICFLFCIY